MTFVTASSIASMILPPSSPGKPSARHRAATQSLRRAIADGCGSTRSVCDAIPGSYCHSHRPPRVIKRNNAGSCCFPIRPRATPIGGKRTGPAMEFAHEQSGRVLIVKLGGRLDSATAQSAEENLVRALPGERPLVAVDLSRLEYISSAGLRVLLVVAKKVQQAGGKLALFG